MEKNYRAIIEAVLFTMGESVELGKLADVIELDKKVRDLKVNGDNLRQERNKTSDEIGILYRDKKIEEANSKKERVKEINAQLINIEKDEESLTATLKELMMNIPQIIDDSVPIGKMILKM